MVAGLEPEKTNQFLQQLAHCASDHSLDFCEAVRMSLEGVDSFASSSLFGDRALIGWCALAPGCLR